MHTKKMVLNMMNTMHSPVVQDNHHQVAQQCFGVKMKVFLGVHVDFTAGGDNGVQSLHGGRGQLTQQLRGRGKQRERAKGQSKGTEQRDRAKGKNKGKTFGKCIRQEQRETEWRETLVFHDQEGAV